MPLTPELSQELSILSLFNPSTLQEGIKVHEHSATHEDVAATKRLFEKGLITQQDGGYLTALGRDALEHLQDLILILSS
ncbi:TIGR02647 family protein [Bermanella sp. R86510]|uniref:TIGR02647 family protein n=1 Tax=unclassified Bermanella TaxID=2627862 RepID=UPI0037CC0BFB